MAKKKEQYLTVAEAAARWLGLKKEESEVPAVLKGFNPLQLRAGDVIRIETPKLMKYKGFVVAMVDIYERRIGGKVFQFADYVLVDDTTEATQKWVTLRVNPVETGVPDAPTKLIYLVLTPHIECEWDSEVEKVWKEVLPQGELQVELPGNSEPVLYRRVDGLTAPYVATVTEFKGDDPESESETISYWDLVREVRPGKQEYYFFERNERTGKVQTFVGEPVHDGDVKLRRKEVGK